MKVALLLPGYLDSADYAHLKLFDQRLTQIGYTVERIDQCNIWQTGNAKNYTITNFIKQIEKHIEFYRAQNPEEIILLGHSQGAMIAIIVAAHHQIESHLLTNGKIKLHEFPPVISPTIPPHKLPSKFPIPT